MAENAADDPEIPETNEETNENNEKVPTANEEEPTVEEKEETPEGQAEAKVEEAADNQSNNPPAEEPEDKPEEITEEKEVEPSESQPASEAGGEAEPDNEAKEAAEAPKEDNETEGGATSERTPEEAAPEAATSEQNEEGAEANVTSARSEGEPAASEAEKETMGQSSEVPPESEKAPTEGEEEEAGKEKKSEGQKSEGQESEMSEATIQVRSDTSKTELGSEVSEGTKEQMHAHFEEEAQAPESPARVGEKLSREGSVGEPEPKEEGAVHLVIQSPTTDIDDDAMKGAEQEEEEDEEEEEEEEEDDEMVFDRELLIEKYRQAHAERQQLIQQNNVLQTKLAEYFRKKKADTESSGKSEMEKSIADQEQRYLKYIANLEDLRNQYGEFQEEYLVQIDDLKSQCTEKQEKVDGETTKFMEFKKLIGLKSINSRSGKPIAPKELEVFLANEDRKEKEVVQVRLKNIKLLNGLRKEELALKSKEELAEGLHLIDFEQLKIENQTYNEKIEERNEELMKLRKKITSTVQVLTHLKEKLQFVLQENQGQRNRLNEVDAQVAHERDLLTRTKQSRDALRIDNNKLRQNCGLLGNEALLRNFEDCVDHVDDKKKRLDLMRMEHAELTLNYNGLKRKIEQAKVTSAMGHRL